MTTDTPLRLLRLPDVEGRVGLRRSMIHRLEQRGEFPRRVRISARAAGWIESEINDYIHARIAASRITAA
ncbi:MAG: helix-turn-helix transcriptional regulator [Steroidobacteraceae bacterium]